jgi:hypothetical protein
VHLNNQKSTAVESTLHDFVQLSSIDFDLTESFIDTVHSVVSHKALDRENKIQVDPTSDLYLYCHRGYLLSNTVVDFVPIHDFYKHDRRRGYCGFKVVAKKDFNRGHSIPGMTGVIAEVPELPYKVTFSVFQKKHGGKEMMMLCTLAFVNSSCEPNCKYVYNKNKQGIISLQTKRYIREGEEITVYYGKGFFGERDKYCKCPFTHKHGR